MPSRFSTETAGKMQSPFTGMGMTVGGGIDRRGHHLASVFYGRGSLEHSKAIH
jgi:hypothetical protein